MFMDLKKITDLSYATKSCIRSIGQLSIAVQLLWRPGLLDCLGCMDEAKLEVAKVLKEALQHPATTDLPMEYQWNLE